MVRICIIGGGPGGLFTARFLLRKEPSVDITVLEATPRFGGKILTKQFEAAPVIYEAGVAELYHPKKLDDTLLDLLKEYGFSFIKMGGDASIYKGRVVIDMNAIKDVVGESCWKSLTEFIRLGKQHRKPEDFAGAGWPADNNHPWSKLTLREVLDKYVLNGDAKMFFEKIIKSDLATEPGITNGAYGFDNYLVDDPDYCQIYTVTEGISSLIKAMTQELSGKVKLLANSPVRSVKPIDSGYRVVYKDEERLIADEFDAVIVCLPVQWIPSVDFGGSLGSAVADHFAYYHYPAHYLRVACLFQKPFWHEAVGKGSYFRLDAFGGCCVYDETSRYPHPPYGVLNWLIAGSNAEAMSNLDDSLLITRAMESLPPELANQAKDLLVEGHVHRWIGSVNGQPGGLPVQDIKTKHLVDPKNHPTFVMVGDYLFDSTLNGLIDSADIGTKLLLENLQTSGNIRKNPRIDYALTPRVKKLMRK
jgi:protoporphyrinogen oxidase